MPHPIMFDEDDPVLARVRAVALALPGAAEKIAHGRPVFFTTRVFAYYGGSVRTGGDWERHDAALILQADLTGRELLRQRPDAFVPAYLGPAGWTGLDLTHATPKLTSDILTGDELLIAVCDRAYEELDTQPLHWSVPDPARAGSPGAFETAYDELTRRVDLLAASIEGDRP